MSSKCPGGRDLLKFAMSVHKPAGQTDETVVLSEHKVGSLA